MGLLRQVSTSIDDCTDFTLSTWFRLRPDAPDGEYAIIEFGEFGTNSTSFISVFVESLQGKIRTRFSSPTGFDPVFEVDESFHIALNATDASAFPVGTWQHLFVTIQFRWTDAEDVTGPWPYYIYLGGVSVGHYLAGSGMSEPLTPGRVYCDSAQTASLPRAGNGILVNGFEIGIPQQLGSIDPDGNAFTQGPHGFSDFQVWFGKYIDPTVSANLSKFISLGRPVNPASAAGIFGTQSILLKGAASTWITNAGTGGAFAKTGTVNDLAPGPPDAV